ncbi:hypothetical protein ACHHYP_13177 [Achlya hypogyna]|uniref:Transmembrane protein n=1 Tax=Achlya hypogyna TaxID=1202772 RepID=A0A1V9YFV5_ACHHY|nr:hypothetical protein ACHHYP_13177 [Achlya hypogyna]
MASFARDYAALGLRTFQAVFAILGLAGRAACFNMGSLNGVEVHLGGPVWDASLVFLCIALGHSLHQTVPELQSARRLRKLRNSVYDTTRTDHENHTMLEALTITPAKRREILTDTVLFLVGFPLAIGASVASYNANCAAFAAIHMIDCGTLRLLIASTFLVSFGFFASIGLWLHAIDPEERFVYIKFVVWPPPADDVSSVEASAVKSDDGVKYSEGAVRYTGTNIPDSARGFRPHITPIDV